MALSVLITQCLQRDFVDPLAPHAPLPNKLHVGREEALRLLGPDPAHGPVGQLIGWARSQARDTLEILHIRDWHDPSDARQRDHLSTFGAHCIGGTPGATLVAGLEDGRGPNEHVVNAIALNDFEDTDLAAHLARIQARAGGEPLRIGVVGVWTEAKVSFLLYDLKTRCHVDALATSSALTASASRAQHFNALEQLKKILGVSCFDSVGEFASWLLPSGTEVRPPPHPTGFSPSLEVQGQTELAADDQDILGFLYRDSSRVTLLPLSGGFSGARVFKVASFDSVGHEQAPSVAKLGPNKLIGSERAAFERVEEILGNNAPSVRGFVDLGARAGIKYSYAAMGQGKVRTLKSLFEHDAPDEQIERVLTTACGEILGKFYGAAQYERLPLLAHYGFSPKWADSVRKKVESVVGAEASKDRLRFGRDELPNVVDFYARFLAEQATEHNEYHYVSYVHGDLNGANILIDGRENVWIIDFFHTGRGHVLKDLAKLENDLLYIFTPLDDEAMLAQALGLSRALRDVDDLRSPLAESLEGLEAPALRRAWRILRVLRGLAAKLCQDDRHPLQLSIALLRYAVHTLSFDESTALQKRWALAAACGHADDVMRTTAKNKRLRVDWLEPLDLIAPGRLGMTLCPGRRDRGRSLTADVDTLKDLGADELLCLCTDEELEWAGAADLRDACAQRGIAFHKLAIPDQRAPSLADAERLVRGLLSTVQAGKSVVVHCMGGLGRTGTLAACVLVARGMSPEVAIQAVRRSRDPRAVETPEQARFVGEFAEGRSSQ